MRNKDLIKKLSMFDPEGVCTLRYWNPLSGGNETVSIKDVSIDEGVDIEDYQFWDCLSDYRDIRQMEDSLGASESDPLAFVSLIVLS